MELEPQAAPRTVENFLKYVKKGQYNGTIFHRVIPGFMIQGGGYVDYLGKKRTDASIPNEADRALAAGLKNKRGTVAMARTPDPHSAAAEFFINTVEQPVPGLQGQGQRQDLGLLRVRQGREGHGRRGPHPGREDQLQAQRFPEPSREARAHQGSCADPMTDRASAGAPSLRRLRSRRAR